MQVGAAISMMYITGQPIVFVGAGQTYSDVKNLNVQCFWVCTRGCLSSGYQLSSHNKGIVRLQSLNNYKLERIVLSYQQAELC